MKLFSLKKTAEPCVRGGVGNRDMFVSRVQRAGEHTVQRPALHRRGRATGIKLPVLSPCRVNLYPIIVLTLEKMQRRWITTTVRRTQDRKTKSNQSLLRRGSPPIRQRRRRPEKKYAPDPTRKRCAAAKVPILPYLKPGEKRGSKERSTHPPNYRRSSY
jgi:hypothetical protein